MAFFRLEAKIISRENRGRSVIAAAAYRAGTKIKDELRDKIYDYTRRVKGVIKSDIIAPQAAQPWVHDPGELWNRVERTERRKDSQLAREFVLAIPQELTPNAQFQTAVNWAQKELVNRGMVAEVSLHHSRSGINPHVHILCTMRRLDGQGFNSKKAIEWDDKATLFRQRKSWAAAVNAALEAAGRPERVDHRSLKDQGIDRLPEPKIGVAATAMKRKGLVEDPERFKAVREVHMMNETRPLMKAILKTGEVQLNGIGTSWLERSLKLLERVREQAAELAKNAWQKLLDAKRQKDDNHGPER